MSEYETEVRKAQPYVDRIKATLLRNEMFTGAYDRLWKMLECHEVDVREPGDGTFIPAAKWDEIEDWLARTEAQFYAKPNHRHYAKPEDHRPNRYDGVCVLCGAKVPAGTGRIDWRDSGSGYNTSHLSGRCPERPLTPAAKATANGSARADFSAVARGYYATVSATGKNDFDFWKVTEGRKPGYRFVKRYIGGSGPIRISTGEAVSALKAILAEGTDVCGDRFADELGQCRDCGLPLTDETSRSLRRGPVCRSK